MSKIDFSTSGYSRFSILLPESLAKNKTVDPAWAPGISGNQEFIDFTLQMTLLMVNIFTVYTRNSKTISRARFHPSHGLGRRGWDHVRYISGHACAGHTTTPLGVPQKNPRQILYTPHIASISMAIPSGEPPTP